MINFSAYITEAVSDESKLTHLEHAEDHVLNAGEKGFSHAYHNLVDVHDKLKGKHNNTTVSTKYDGSPSIVFGHHPETGKFFVGSKSVFNKTPKINYTNEDIDKHHGHAPGLAEKLKTALKHLPKVTPKHGVFQGDVMHSGVKSKSNPHGDVEEHGGKYHFKPNTITYSTKTHSDEGQKLKTAKIGVAVHTAYTGHSLDHMKANYNADVSHFKSHPDVHTISTHHDFSKAHYPAEAQHEFQHHIEKAVHHFNTSHKDTFKATEPHTTHLKTYINSTVKTGHQPSVAGYQEHLKKHFTGQMSKLKTEKGISRVGHELKQHLSHVEHNQEHFNHVLQMHKHLAAAKNVLVHAMSKDDKFEHHIAGQKAKPEGFVSVRNNRPTKLVDRAEFSRANFLARSK